MRLLTALAWLEHLFALIGLLTVAYLAWLFFVALKSARTMDELDQQHLWGIE